jgi:AraC-like DNA-binding protein
MKEHTSTKTKIGRITPFKADIDQVLIPTTTYESFGTNKEDGYSEYFCDQDCEIAQEDMLEWLNIPDLSRLEREWNIKLSNNLRFHAHSHCQISRNITGAIAYTIKGETIFLTSKDILLVNPNIPHTWVAKAHTVCNHIVYYPQMLDFNNYCVRFLPYANMIYSSHFPFILISEGNKCYEELQSILEDIVRFSAHHDSGFDILIHNRVIDFSITLAMIMLDNGTLKKIDRDAVIIQRAIEFINFHYKENISVQQVADFVGMNQDYFSHYFKDKFGISCKRLINMKRIELAASLLMGSDTDIIDIVHECGFSSVSTFYNVFSNCYDISPAKYRKFFLK